MVPDCGAHVWTMHPLVISATGTVQFGNSTNPRPMSDVQTSNVQVIVLSPNFSEGSTAILFTKGSNIELFRSALVDPTTFAAGLNR